VRGKSNQTPTPAAIEKITEIKYKYKEVLAKGYPNPGTKK
jgi:hypothetical protein